MIVPVSKKEAAGKWINPYYRIVNGKKQKVVRYYRLCSNQNIIKRKLNDRRKRK